MAAEAHRLQWGLVWKKSVFRYGDFFQRLVFDDVITNV